VNIVASALGYAEGANSRIIFGKALRRRQVDRKYDIKIDLRSKFYQEGL
jgi:hypothetical protein